MTIKYFEHKDLLKQIRRMFRSGGKPQIASGKVRIIRSKIQDNELNPFHGYPTTNHGESRIKNCVKYDLTGFARLVTITEKNLVCLRFVGSHDEVDKWLDRNRGLTLTSSKTHDLVEINISQNAEKPDGRISYEPDNFVGRILERIDGKHRDSLIGDLPSRVTEPIRELKADASKEAIWQSLFLVSEQNLRQLLFDVLVLLGSGDIKLAEDRIRFSHLANDQDKLVAVEELSEDEILTIKDGESVRSIQIGSPEYEAWVNIYLDTASDLDWFLFMHPEQEKFVEVDYAGPAKLSGVSGSGKTCISVRRAVRLANKYPQEEIAIVTLNRSLSSLISGLVDHICPQKHVRERIKVYSFFELCQELLNEFEPGNSKLYSDVTWGLEEHIDEIFREFYRCQASYTKARVLQPLHRSLSALGFDSENYIREEFDWIRSAISKGDRDEYLDIERSGRGYKLDKARRGPILEGLEYWEEKMKDVGVIDYPGLTTALNNYKNDIRPRFRSILVDEVQDFGTTELELVRKLVLKDENDIFVCGDLAQHILPKHQSFSSAGIEVAGRSNRILKNYRNSREILRAAYEVLLQNLNEEMFKGGDMEIFDPEFAPRSSTTPVVLKASSIAEEIACAIELMADNSEQHKERGTERPHRGCIVLAGYSNYEISIFGDRVNIPVLDGSNDILGGDLFFSDLEQTKGYEFDTVVILNCNNQVLPPEGALTEETFRYGCQLYVAMTRARDQLVLSYSGEPSDWLNIDGETLSFHDWDSFIDIAVLEMKGEPGHLPEVPDSENDKKAVMALLGEGFNYTMYARGLSGDVHEKLEELVPGRSQRRGKHRVLWKDVDQLFNDMRYASSEGRTGYIFGPSADRQVLEALERAQSGARPIARRQVKKQLLDIKSHPESDFSADDTHLYDPGKLGVSIRKLDLTIETQAALRAQGLKSIGDVLKTSSLKLRRSPYFGGGRVEEIRVALNSRGFQW